MFARVSNYQGPPNQVDEGIRTAREQILPRAAELDGYKGAYFLVDRQSGRSVSITLWESEEAMRASEEAANQLRSESAQASGGEIVSVERYEVAISPEQQG
jgi:heme-degrading monooxygenase HmoA